MHIRNKIKQRRIELGIDADQLGKKIGKSRTTIYRYENGDIRDIPASILEPLSKVLLTSPDELMGWDCNPHNNFHDITIGERIHFLRKKNKLTLEKLGDMIGVGKSTVRKWENGMITNMGCDKIIALSKALGTNPNQLMNWDENINSSPIHNNLVKCSISERIVEGMNLREYKQADLVRLTGISKGALSSYISGRYIPKQNNIYAIAKALNVNESWLMGNDVPITRINNSSGAVTINVLGRVAAGVPLSAVEDIIDTEEISESLASTGEFFGLLIKGDSMEPRICDGDVVIVRQQSDADNGDIVIALVNGYDATCKRLMKYTGGISLISLNSKYEPIVFTDQDIVEKPVTIIGKVIELRGKL